MLIFFLFLLSFGFDLELGTAHLVIHKELECLTCDIFGVGHNVTVNVHAHNMGDGSAYNVQVNDTVPRKFSLVTGDTEGELGEILGGETRTWSYVVTTDET